MPNVEIVVVARDELSFVASRAADHSGVPDDSARVPVELELVVEGDERLSAAEIDLEAWERTLAGSRHGRPVVSR